MNHDYDAGGGMAAARERSGQGSELDSIRSEASRPKVSTTLTTDVRKVRKKKPLKGTIPKPYLATAPPAITALPSDSEGRAGTGLILPSTYVRSLHSPQPKRPSHSARPSFSSARASPSPIPTRQTGYAANLLSPPAVMPGQASAPASRSTPSLPLASRGYAAQLLAPPSIMPGGLPAQPLSSGMSRPSLPTVPSGSSMHRVFYASHNRSAGSLHDEAGQPSPPATPAPRRRRRRLVNQETTTRRMTVRSIEEGRGLARGASMRRVNVWDDVPDSTDVPEAEEPPPPFPFPTASNTRAPPTFSDDQSEGLPPIPNSPPPSFDVAIAAGANPTPPARSPSPTPTQSRHESPPTVNSSSGADEEEEEDGRGDSDEDEDARYDRQMWTDDILAGYSLAERVEREAARRRTRFERAEAEAAARQAEAEAEAKRAAAEEAARRAEEELVHRRREALEASRRAREEAAAARRVEAEALAARRAEIAAAAIRRAEVESAFKELHDPKSNLPATELDDAARETVQVLAGRKVSKAEILAAAKEALAAKEREASTKHLESVKPTQPVHAIESPGMRSFRRNEEPGVMYQLAKPKSSPTTAPSAPTRELNERPQGASPQSNRQQRQVSVQKRLPSIERHSSINRRGSLRRGALSSRPSRSNSNAQKPSPTADDDAPRPLFSSYAPSDQGSAQPSSPSASASTRFHTPYLDDDDDDTPPPAPTTEYPVIPFRSPLPPQTAARPDRSPAMSPLSETGNNSPIEVKAAIIKALEAASAANSPTVDVPKQAQLQHGAVTRTEEPGVMYRLVKGGSKTSSPASSAPPSTSAALSSTIEPSQRPASASANEHAEPPIHPSPLYRKMSAPLLSAKAPLPPTSSAPPQLPPRPPLEYVNEYRSPASGSRVNPSPRPITSTSQSPHQQPPPSHISSSGVRTSPTSSNTSELVSTAKPHTSPQTGPVHHAQRPAPSRAGSLQSVSSFGPRPLPSRFQSVRQDHLPQMMPRDEPRASSQSSPRSNDQGAQLGAPTEATIDLSERPPPPIRSASLAGPGQTPLAPPLRRATSDATTGYEETARRRVLPSTPRQGAGLPAIPASSSPPAAQGITTPPQQPRTALPTPPSQPSSQPPSQPGSRRPSSAFNFSPQLTPTNIRPSAASSDRNEVDELQSSPLTRRGSASSGKALPEPPPVRGAPPTTIPPAPARRRMSRPDNTPLPLIPMARPVTDVQEEKEEVLAGPVAGKQMPLMGRHQSQGGFKRSLPEPGRRPSEPLGRLLQISPADGNSEAAQSQQRPSQNSAQDFANANRSEMRAQPLFTNPWPQSPEHRPSVNRQTSDVQVSITQAPSPPVRGPRLSLELQRDLESLMEPSTGDNDSATGRYADAEASQSVLPPRSGESHHSSGNLVDIDPAPTLHVRRESPVLRLRPLQGSSTASSGLRNDLINRNGQRPTMKDTAHDVVPAQRYDAAASYRSTASKDESRGQFANQPASSQPLQPAQRSQVANGNRRNNFRFPAAAKVQDAAESMPAGATSAPLAASRSHRKPVPQDVPAFTRDNESRPARPALTMRTDTKSLAPSDPPRGVSPTSPGLGKLYASSSALLEKLENEDTPVAESSAQGAAKAAARVSMRAELDEQLAIEAQIKADQLAAQQMASVGRQVPPTLQEQDDAAIAAALQAEADAENAHMRPQTSNDAMIAAALAEPKHRPPPVNNWRRAPPPPPSKASPRRAPPAPPGEKDYGHPAADPLTSQDSLLNDVDQHGARRDGRDSVPPPVPPKDRKPAVPAWPAPARSDSSRLNRRLSALEKGKGRAVPMAPRDTQGEEGLHPPVSYTDARTPPDTLSAQPEMAMETYSPFPAQPATPNERNMAIRHSQLPTRQQSLPFSPPPHPAPPQPPIEPQPDVPSIQCPPEHIDVTRARHVPVNSFSSTSSSLFETGDPLSGQDSRRQSLTSGRPLGPRPGPRGGRPPPPPPPRRAWVATPVEPLDEAAPRAQEKEARQPPPLPPRHGPVDAPPVSAATQLRSPMSRGDNSDHDETAQNANAESTANANLQRNDQAPDQAAPTAEPNGDGEDDDFVGEYTDADVLASRLEGTPNEYEGLNHIISFLGPGRDPAATPAMLSTLLTAPVEVESRRVNTQGKTKVKLAVLGVRVTTCPVCLSQFRGTDTAVLFPRCGHVAHQSCATRWLRESDRCMVCREPLDDRL